MNHAERLARDPTMQAIIGRKGLERLAASSRQVGRLALEPVIARYRERGIDLYFRADAAFAKPEIYELLEHEGIRYAIC